MTEQVFFSHFPTVSIIFYIYQYSSYFQPAWGYWQLVYKLNFVKTKNPLFTRLIHGAVCTKLNQDFLLPFYVKYNVLIVSKFARKKILNLVINDLSDWITLKWQILLDDTTKPFKLTFWINIWKVNVDLLVNWWNTQNKKIPVLMSTYSVGMHLR